MPRSLSGVLSALFRSRREEPAGRERAWWPSSDSSPQAAPTHPVRRAARSAVESLERRTMLAVTTLTNGIVEGSVTIQVDAYGAYGSATTPAGDALFRPTGQPLPQGTTYQSALYFGAIDDFLAEAELDPTGQGIGQQPAVAFTGVTPTSAISTFTLGGFAVNLTQVLNPVNLGGSIFTQTYQITNNTGASQTLKLVRHVDGEIDFLPGQPDFGGVSADRSSLFEFDSAQPPTVPTAFFGITDQGGTRVGYTIQPYGTGYFDDIVAADGIPAGALNTIFGDGNNNGITDTGYDVTLSMQSDLTFATGETLTFVTVTVFGQAAPVDVVGQPTVRFQPANFSQSERGPVATITVVRSGGLLSAASVNFATVAGGSATAGLDYLDTSGTLNFAPGQTTATFDIPLLDDTLLEGDETVQIQLSAPGTGTQLGQPSQAVLTILDDTAVVSFEFDSFFVLENEQTVLVTLNRTGFIDSPASVTFSTQDITASEGLDYEAVTTTVNFVAGQTVATVEVPITLDLISEADEDFQITLTGGGDTVTGPPSTAIVTILDFEPPPFVTDVDTVGVANLITEIVVTFSVPIDATTAVLPTNWDVFARREKRLGGSPARNRYEFKSIEYNAQTNQVILETVKPLKTNRFYELNISATRTNPIQAPPLFEGLPGVALDGNGDTIEGDDYRSYFGRGQKLDWFDLQGDRISLRMQNAGIMDVNRPAIRDEIEIEFPEVQPGAATLVGKFGPFKRLTDNRAILRLINGAGVIRDLPPQFIVLENGETLEEFLARQQNPPAP